MMVAAPLFFKSPSAQVDLMPRSVDPSSPQENMLLTPTMLEAVRHPQVISLCCLFMWSRAVLPARPHLSK